MALMKRQTLHVKSGDYISRPYSPSPLVSVQGLETQVQLQAEERQAENRERPREVSIHAHTSWYMYSLTSHNTTDLFFSFLFRGWGHRCSFRLRGGRNGSLLSGLYVKQSKEKHNQRAV